MRKGIIITLLVVVALIGVGAGVTGWISGKYNHLVVLYQDTNMTWANVQVEYQRRNDLVPNFVATVQGAANFERGTLTDVTEARAKATQPQVKLGENLLDNPQAFQKFQQAQSNLGAALGRLLVVVERYPELKAVQNFTDLQTQLEGTENRISNARRVYGESAQKYNTQRKLFPDIIIASFLNFQERPYFEADAAAQTAPKVNFNQPPSQQQ